jgi:thiol-disulfide isomerase/thioredoxin
MAPRRSFEIFLFFGLLALFFTLPAAPAAAGEPAPREAGGIACHGSPELRYELAFASTYYEFCPGGWDLECIESKRQGAERLQRRFPDDPMVRMLLQEAVTSWPQAKQGAVEKMREEARAEAEAHPDDPMARYLHLRSRFDEIGVEESRRRLAELVEAAPELPWPHLDLAELWVNPPSREKKDDVDPEVATRHLERFVELCPGRFLTFIYYGSLGLGTEEMWQRRLPELRQRVEASAPLDRARRFPYLWALELRYRPQEELDAQRQRMRRDLAELEKLDLEGYPSWWQTLLDGYRQVLDHEGVERIEERYLATFPCDARAAQLRIKRWSREHDGAAEPLLTQGGDVPPLPELYRALGDWLERCPENSELLARRYLVMTGLPALPAAKVLRDVEAYVALWETGLDRIYAYYYVPYGEIAQHLVDRGLAQERALELIERQRALDAEAQREGYRPESESDAAKERRKRIATIRELELTLTAADARMALHQPDAAGEELEKAGTLADTLRALESTPHRWPGLASRRWQLESELAELRDRPAEAFAFALRAATVGEDGDLDHAEELWHRLGGGDDGWRALTRHAEELAERVVQEEPTPWEDHDIPLPDFELADVDGKIWTLDDLRGKAVLINVWTTWCGPCRKEMPYLQELRQRIADRDDLAVVTLNVDENPGVVLPFLKEQGYGFPTLLGAGFVDDLEEPLSSPGVPQNWLVDAEGTVRRWQSGFRDAEAESWVDDMVAELERLAATGGGRSPGR